MDRSLGLVWVVRVCQVWVECQEQVLVCQEQVLVCQVWAVCHRWVELVECHRWAELVECPRWVALEVCLLVCHLAWSKWLSR